MSQVYFTQLLEPVFLGDHATVFPNRLDANKLVNYVDVLEIDLVKDWVIMGMWRGRHRQMRPIWKVYKEV